MSQHEKNNYNNPETSSAELGREGEEHRERIRENLERSIEKDSKDNLEKARKEVLEQSRTEKEQTASERHASPAERRNSPISKKERDVSFKRTMSEIRAHMPPVKRVFSKFIHNKAIEKTSEAIGSTIARPNAILSGAILAFVFTLGIYLIAKQLGYRLSGFETIGSFILGWIVGLIYDYVRLLITGKK